MASCHGPPHMLRTVRKSSRVLSSVLALFPPAGILSSGCHNGAAVRRLSKKPASKARNREARMG